MSHNFLTTRTISRFEVVKKEYHHSVRFFIRYSVRERKITKDGMRPCVTSKKGPLLVMSVTPSEKSLYLSPRALYLTLSVLASSIAADRPSTNSGHRPHKSPFAGRQQYRPFAGPKVSKIVGRWSHHSLHGVFLSTLDNVLMQHPEPSNGSPHTSLRLKRHDWRR